MSQMHNLTTLIKRLEAATSRLEDMIPSAGDVDMTDTDPTTTTSGGLRSAAPSNPSHVNAPTAAPLPAREEAPSSITDFDGLIGDAVRAFGKKSEEIGGLVAEQANAVLRAFQAEKVFITITTKSKKPDIQSKIYMEILKELQSTMGQVNDIREANRASPLFTHLTTVSEGIAVLGWITIDPKPVDYINEVLSSAQFYGNRIINLNKDKDKKQVEWVNAFYRVFKDLAAYVQTHFSRGIIWNNQGVDPQDALREAQSSSDESSSLPSASRSGASATLPPPPPPPPLPTLDNGPVRNSQEASKSSGGDMGAVFSQLSQGSAVTAGLKKVDASQMTHKNPALRSDRHVVSNSSNAPGKAPTSSAGSNAEQSKVKKLPQKVLEGNKWLIENYDAPSTMLEIEASISHSILISRCSKTTIRVIGKANAISIDNSPHLSLVVDSLVSSVDVIKSSKFEMQVLGALPTVMLDQVDSAQIFLSRGSLGTEMFTSKCSAININLPGASDTDDYTERALPEQIKSVIRNGAVVSEIVEHAG